jgi:hypothetical protein
MDEANKSALRAEVELLTRVYLESGGKIEKVPTGKGGLVEMTAQERARPFFFFGAKFKWSAKKDAVAPHRA